MYTLRLATALEARGHEVGILTARVRAGRAQNELLEESVGGLQVWGLVQNYPYRDLPEAVVDPGVDRVAGDLMDRWKPDLLAVQTLAGLSLGILDEGERRGIPSVLHLHDGWWSCPSGGQRLHPDGSLCLPVRPERCGACFDRFRHREGPLERASRWLADRLPRAMPADLLHRGFHRLPGTAKEGLRKVNERAARRQTETAPPPCDRVDPRIEERNDSVARALSKVQRCLSPTRFLLDSLSRDGLHFSDARVVATGVPISTGPKANDIDGDLRVLFLGTWVEHKGAHVLARALATTRAEVEARAAGPAPFPVYRRDVLDASEGRLRALGTLNPDDVREQMDWADVVVVPSLWAENAPLVVLEARAAGRPVIASNVGGIPELIEDGVDGRLFPAGDSGALAELLEDAAGIRALPVRPPRSMEDFADDVLDHYREILA